MFGANPEDTYYEFRENYIEMVQKMNGLRKETDK